MRITESQLRRTIRRIIQEAEGDAAPEMTDAEKAAKAATIPNPNETKPTPAEADVSPVEAFTQALARKMRKKGVPESTVTAMIDGTKGLS